MYCMGLSGNLFLSPDFISSGALLVSLMDLHLAHVDRKTLSLVFLTSLKINISIYWIYHNLAYID